jgi:L-lactate dehydrogenase (cytochrome)
MNMRLLGAPTLKDVVPSMVDASNIHSHIVSVPGDNLYNNNCEASSSLLRSELSINSSCSDESLPLARLRELKSKM